MSNLDSGILITSTTRVWGWMDFEAPTVVFDDCHINRSSLGAYTSVSKRTDIKNSTIGRYTSIGPSVLLNPGNHPIDWVSTSPVLYDQNVFGWYGKNEDSFDSFPNRYPSLIIGNDVWIGANAIVMGGVTVGDGAIIGAGAVVTKDVAPYTVVGGVAAQHIRDRFSHKTMRRISSIEWWKYDLVSWKRDGTLPSMRNVDDETLDAMEQAIASGAVPLIQGRRRKVTFEGNTSKIQRIPD